jgi:xanthine dehydrogenase accessory factor
VTDDHREVYEALLNASKDGIPIALATVISTQGSMPRHAGSKMVVYSNGDIVGTVGGGAMESKVIQSALQSLADGFPRTETYTLNSLDDGDPGICGGTAQIFIEPLSVAPLLLVIGGGHVGKALCELGKWAGFRVMLSDDRPEYANATYASNLERYIVCKPSELTQHVIIDAQTYVCAVTRGLPVDLQLLPLLLATPAKYIGLIGSRRRWTLTYKALKEQFNLSAEQLQRIHSPIGLEIGAESPKEIALSIMAEITMLRRGGDGKTMKMTLNN